MADNKTLATLEKKRSQMIEIAMKDGFNSPEVIDLSEEVDKLIYLTMVASQLEVKK